LNRGARDTRRAGLQLGTWLEFHRAIYSGPVCTHNLGSMGDGLQLRYRDAGSTDAGSTDGRSTNRRFFNRGTSFNKTKTFFQSRYIPQQNANGFESGRSRYTPGRFAAGDRVGVLSRDPLRAGLQLRAGLHAQPRTEHALRIGMQFDQRRAGLHAQPWIHGGRFAVGRLGWSSIEGSTPGRFAAAGRDAVRSRDPLRDGLQLRAGMQFDRGIDVEPVCSWGPGWSSIERSTPGRVASTNHAPAAHVGPR
jgi:hypothetical protein